MLQKVDRLKIGFVTDIHLNKLGLQKLQAWIDEHYNTQPRFDYCLIGGDTANCDHTMNTHDEDEMMRETLQTHSTLKSIFQCKMFFVPGNHDCKQFYTPKPDYDDFLNMHNRRTQIAQGLDLVGFGGSVPAYVNHQHYWAGYPYLNEEDVAEEWSKTKTIQSTHSKNQFIFLTHVGPSDSETTKDRRHLFPESIVQCGSSFLNQYLIKKELLAWVHGHSHEGSKLATFGGSPVMNPGALKNDEFMYFQVVKEEEKWKMGKKVYEIL